MPRGAVTPLRPRLLQAAWQLPEYGRRASRAPPPLPPPPALPPQASGAVRCGGEPSPAPSSPRRLADVVLARQAVVMAARHCTTSSDTGVENVDAEMALVLVVGRGGREDRGKREGREEEEGGKEGERGEPYAASTKTLDSRV